MNDVALAVEGLSVELPAGDGWLPAVRDVSFALRPGEALGLVGPSGSGKTSIALAVLGLLSASARVSGSVRVAGTELLGLDDRALSRIRGNRLALVFQEPASALNPVLAIGRQIEEAVLAHRPCSRDAARARSVELLERVGVAAAARRLGALPHELSGGLRQRVAIAIAIACEPDVVIADEPTTGLDTLAQAQVLDALDVARRDAGAALLLITHDLAVVASRVDRVAVLDAGTVVESAPVAELFSAPRSRVGRALVEHQVAFEAGPPARPAADPVGGAPILAAADLVKRFAVRSGRRAGEVDAVGGVSFTLTAGRALGLVGETGSGKSTVARMLVGLLAPTSGTVLHRGVPVTGARRERRRLAADVQIVFQDPDRSLDPRMTVAQLVRQPLRIHRRAATEQTVHELLDDRRACACAGRPPPARAVGG